MAALVLILLVFLPRFSYADCKCQPVDIDYYINSSTNIVLGVVYGGIKQRKSYGFLEIDIDIKEWLKPNVKNKDNKIKLLTPKDCLNPLYAHQVAIIFISHGVTTKCSSELLAFYNMNTLYSYLKSRF